MLPDTTTGRLRWAVHEALVVAGILLFWIAAALVLSLFAGVLRLVIETVQLRLLVGVYEFVHDGQALWAAVAPLTGITASIYGLARAGTVVVDHYRATER